MEFTTLWNFKIIQVTAGTDSMIPSHEPELCSLAYHFQLRPSLGQEHDVLVEALPVLRVETQLHHRLQHAPSGDGVTCLEEKVINYIPGLMRHGRVHESRNWSLNRTSLIK